jgi:MFS transporter, DHA1 family, inner membrane transport protein
VSGRLYILPLGTFAVGTGAFVIAGILPAIADQLGITVVTAGLLVTIFSFTYALGSPLLATLTANVPRRPLLLAVMALFTVSNVLAALAPGFELLAVARVVAACAAALFTPTAGAVVAAAAPPEQRGRALALITAGLTTASVLGVPLGTWIGFAFDWRATFWMVAALGAVAFVGLLIALPATAPPPRVPLEARLAMLRNGGFLAQLAVTVLVISGVFTLFTYIAPLLRETARVDGGQLSALLFVFGLGGVIGTAVGGYGADRWGATTVLATSITSSAVGLVVLPFVATSLVGAGLVLFVMGAVGWAFSSPQQVRLLPYAPNAPGLVLSFNASALYLGMGIGPMIGGLVLRFGPTTWLGATGAACLVLALGILFLTHHGASTVAARARPSPVRVRD